MKIKNSSSGFSLIEVLIVLLLLSSGFIILLQALNTSMEMRTKSELLTQQSVLMNDKIQEIRSRRFDENTSSPWSSTLGSDLSTDVSLSFDGNDYVNMGDMLSQSAYTKIAWVKRASGAINNNIISGNTGHALWAPAGYSYKLSAGHNGAWSTVQDNDALTVGVWYFVAVTYNPNVASGTMTLYKNGTQIDNATNIAAQFESTTTYVGSYAGGNNWLGAIHETAIWNEALTAAEIATLYNAENELNASENYGNYSSALNLVGYWKMNEGTGFSTIDHSGNGNNGTISGATWQSTQSSSENSILDWDDIDDFNQYAISEIPNFTAFGCSVKVDYVETSSGFHTAITGPSDYKRVMVEINHKTIPTLRDTFIVSPGL